MPSGDASGDLHEVAADVLDACAAFGLSEPDVLAAAIEAPDDLDDPVDALAAECRIVYGEDAVERSGPAGARTKLLQYVLRLAPPGFSAGYGYSHERNLEHGLDRVLGEYGYGFRFEPVGADEWIEPDREDHPRAFRLVVTDRGGEPVASRAFRYPPTEDGRDATAQQPVLCDALNETVLGEVGLQLLSLSVPDDSYHWFLLDTERLEHLEAEYGRSLAVFGERLVDAGPAFGHPTFVDQSNALDHEAAFGVPLPEDTYRPEEHLAERRERGRLEALLDRVRGWLEVDRSGR